MHSGCRAPLGALRVPIDQASTGDATGAPEARPAHGLAALQWRAPGRLHDVAVISHCVIDSVLTYESSLAYPSSRPSLLRSSQHELEVPVSAFSTESENANR